jgi:hypothetical protein
MNQKSIFHSRYLKTIQQYKDTKQRLQKETRRAYWNYLENIICYDENSELVQKQKIFWNYRRNTKKDSSGVAPLRQEGMPIDDTRQKAEILSKRQSRVVFFWSYLSLWLE